MAPSARGWAPALIAFETLLLANSATAGEPALADARDWPALLAGFDRTGRLLARYPLAHQRLANGGAMLWRPARCCATGSRGSGTD